MLVTARAPSHARGVSPSPRAIRVRRVPAVHEFLADGGERPRDAKRDEQKVEAARQWSKEADVRELAGESSDCGLSDVEAETLIANAGPHARERRATPIRAERQPDGPRAFATQPERDDTEGDEKRRRDERQDPGETGGENRRRDQELREQESLSPQGVTKTVRRHLDARRSHGSWRVSHSGPPHKAPPVSSLAVESQRRYVSAMTPTAVQ